jgi:hypothetical protein
MLLLARRVLVPPLRVLSLLLSRMRVQVRQREAPMHYAGGDCRARRGRERLSGRGGGIERLSGLGKTESYREQDSVPSFSSAWKIKTLPSWYKLLLLLSSAS